MYSNVNILDNSLTFKTNVLNLQTILLCVIFYDLMIILDIINFNVGILSMTDIYGEDKKLHFSVIDLKFFIQYLLSFHILIYNVILLIFLNLGWCNSYFIKLDASKYYSLFQLIFKLKIMRKCCRWDKK